MRDLGSSSASGGLFFLLGVVDRAHAEEVADRVNEVGPVHRVEVEVVDAAVDQIEHLFGGHRRRHQAPRGGIVVEPVEAVGA